MVTGGANRKDMGGGLPPSLALVVRDSFALN
jgi:hypothetical protein